MNTTTSANEKIALGSIFPHVALPMTGDQTFTPSNFPRKKIVIYFYPKDATPGCTTQGNDFTAHMQAFHDANCIILGVSRDSIRKHENFIAKQGFNFALISDANEELCQIFGVIRLKKLYGKEYLGIDRSTFVFDEQHILVKEWRQVKVHGHVVEVLSFVQQM